MKKLKSCRLLVIAAILLLSAVVALSLHFCAHDGEGGQERYARYAQLDSLLGSIDDVDSLAKLVNQYHQADDAVGEMLALKYQGLKLCGASLFNEAVDIHSRGLEIASSLEDTLEVVSAMNNLANDYRHLGELSAASGYYYNSLKLSDTYGSPGDPRALECRVMALNGIGNIEIELRNYATADSVLHEALEGEMSVGDNRGIAVNYANLGSVKRALNDIDSAWYYYRKSLEFNQLDGDMAGEALCHLRFGELREDERNFSHAVEEYKQAYDGLKAVDDNWHLMEACLALAGVSIKLGEVDDAHRYLHEAEEMAVKTGSKEHQAKGHMLHYELSLLEGDHEAALKHYVKGDELQDIIYGMDKNNEIRNHRIEYQRHRLSGEVDMLNNDIAHMKHMRNMQYVLTLLLLLMAGGVIVALAYAVRLRARTQRKMRQVEETRSLFFTNVVHQLRTPLTAIMGAIDVIMSEGRKVGKELYTPVQRENVDIINRQGKNLLMLVDRILEVGGVRSAISSLEWRTGDAVAFLRMLIDSYRERCVERHIELTYTSRESSATIDTVPVYLNTIVGRLIENAIEYSRDFSKITVTSRVDGDMLVIRVADNGIGIGENDLPHVFEPFYRGAAAEQIVDGVGIGLTVVRDMSMAMGGSVAVESMKDNGSVFTVQLPCRHNNGVKKPFEKLVKPLIGITEKTARQQEELPPSEQNGDSRPVVLIIEDHVDVARLVGMVLGEQYEVHYASDGSQGFAKVNELLPDLIITDVKMPNMDGYELCRKVRATRHLCHIPIIMLSARVSDEDRVRGIEAGADAYLVKPFVADEARAWVAQLLESRRLLRQVFSSPADADIPHVPMGDGSDEDDHRLLEDFAREVNRLDNSGVKLDLDKVALSFKMGESQLRRRLQRLTGKTVTAYVTQLRMEKAKNLLQSRPDLLIGEVAEQCGFVDVAYFSRVFRQYYGMTPTQARNNPS
ncbi:MAG: response regulator [Muribaculaceae bacterium]|nr:response regulator [Muribaculaceae bacterium]